MVEREQEPSEEKKEKKSPIKILIEKINKLLAKLQRTPEEEEKLRQLKRKKEKLVASFYQNTDFGKQTKAKKDLLEKSLRGALSELRTASDEERKEKAKKVRQILGRKEEEARSHWQKEPDDLEEKYQEIAEEELKKTIAKAKKEYRQISAEREPRKEINQEKIEEEREKKKQALMRAFPELSDDKIERVMESMNRGERRPYGRQYLVGAGGMEDLSQEEILELAGDNLDAFFRIIDSFPGEFYHEAVRLMGLDAMNKFSNFIIDLTEAPGRGAREVLNEVMEKMKLRKMYHNIICAVEQGGGKLEQLQGMMEMFMPQLFDQTFKEEGAETAAHLYDIGTTTMRSRHGNWVPSEKMLYGAAKRDSDIDIWVRDRLEKILRAKYGNEEFEKRWPKKVREQKLRGIMALGKGFEMATLRMIEEVARGRVPKAREVVSPPYEDFVRPADSFEHFIEKYEDGDPGVNFLMFIITKGEVLPGSSRQEINRLIKQKLQVDPRALRLKDVVNFLGFSGPFKGWRLEKMVEGIPEEVEANLGMAISLQLAEGLAEDTKEKKEKKIEKKKTIIRRELKRNPLRVLREAELQDGEILDPEVQKRVIEETLRQFHSKPEVQKMMKKFFLEKPEPKRRPEESHASFMERIKDFEKEEKPTRKERQEYLDSIEDPLIVLTQLEVEKREGEINFAYLANIFSPEEIEQAQAYYQAIQKVIKEYKERTWTTEEGKSQTDNLVEFLAQKKFPYIPGVDDVPWSEFNFAQVGQKGIARKFRDNLDVEKAMKALFNLQTEIPKLRKGEDIVKVCDEIWKAIRGYSKAAALEKMGDIYEGVARFNAGNFGKRYLPIPFDYAVDWLGDNLQGLGFKSTSYAKDIYGRAACSWRAVDLRNFLNHARLAGHITQDQERELQKKLKCSAPYLWLEGLLRGGPIGVAFVIGVFFKELQAQLEEQLKEQA